MELGQRPTSTECMSILKAISGVRLQQQSRNREALDAEDLMNDPEHIFRVFSMVVRTSELTSIIALALKYVFA
jgi:UDP-glucose 4-epimerase